MTDKKIVLALRIHNDKKLSDCSNCPLSNYENCDELLLQNAIDCIEYYASNKPQGNWIWIVKSTNVQIEPNCFKCSNCNFMFNNVTPFCPNCGADMRSDNNV